MREGAPCRACEAHDCSACLHWLGRKTRASPPPLPPMILARTDGLAPFPPAGALAARMRQVIISWHVIVILSSRILVLQLTPTLCS